MKYHRPPPQHKRRRPSDEAHGPAEAHEVAPAPGVALLRDAGAPGAQRAAAIAGVQRAAGNAVVERALAEQSHLKQEVTPTKKMPKATQSTLPAWQQRQGIAKAGLVERQSSLAAPNTVAAPGDGPLAFRFLGMDYQVENRAHLAEWCRLMGSLAHQEWQRLRREAEHNRYIASVADDMFGLIYAWGLQIAFVQASAGKPRVPDATLLESIARLEQRADQIHTNTEQARAALRRDQIEAAAGAAALEAQRLEQQRLKTIDELRSAFRRGASELAGRILEWADMAADLIDELRKLDSNLAGNWGVPGSSDHKTFKILGRKTLKVVSVAANWASAPGLATEAETTIATMRNVLTVAGAFPGPHTIVTSYLGPALEVVAKLTTRLNDSIRRQNDEAIQLDPDLVRWGAEPGGRPVARFMDAVMRANAVSDVPVPQAEVLRFFQQERSNFNQVMETAKAGPSMPTRSVFWWLIDAERFRAWVFHNRQSVWQLLYGNRQRPEPGSEE